MRAHRTIIGSVIVGLALTVSLTTPARAHPGGHPPGHAGPTSTQTLSAWNETAVSTLTGLPPSAGGAPSAAPIHLAMVQGAVYDAVNAIGPKRHRPYLLTERFSARASRDAAVATAAHLVLSDIVATVPNVLDTARAAVLATLATKYDDSLAGMPDGPSRTEGVAAGTAAAEVMIAARANDGRFGPSAWVPDEAPGHWWPLIDALTGQPQLDPTGWVGDVEPFLLRSASQVRTDGPRELTSTGWARELNEVKKLGAVDSTVRTDHQTYVARWWQSTPLASWNSVARQLLARERLGVATGARLLAMQNLSTADASIGCWSEKYRHDFWRPWNAIPRAAEDGNPRTHAQADWAPLISAPYPEHPSGHLCLDGASTRVLQTFFGDWIKGGFEITSASAFLQPDDERTRRFGSFSRAVAEVLEARIWAGLHYRTGDVQGKALGQEVADYAADRYFQRVHHPH